MSAEFKKVKQRILQLCPPWSQETIGRAIALLDDTAVQKLTGLPNAVFESAVNALLQQARGDQGQKVNAEFRREMERRLDEGLERASKRARCSLTRPEDAAQQGRRIFDAAQQDRSILDQLAALQPASQGAAEGLKEQVDELVGCEDKPAVQRFLNAVFETISPLSSDLQLENRRIFDTSTAGLSFSPEQGRPEPDVSICDRFPTLANLMTVLEAKGRLGNAKEAQLAAFQTVQRCRQMLTVQQSRRRWLMATVGADGVEIWSLQRQGDREVLEAQRSGVQPFAGQHPPPGLEILIRFCCTSDADLGYNPLVAEAMRIGGKLVSDMRLVAVKPNGAKVMAGKWDGRDVVLKTSTRTAREIEIHKYLESSNLQGLVSSLGEFDHGGSKWLVTPFLGQPLACWHGDDSAQLVCLVQQVAETLRALWMKGLIHGDVSPNNIVHANGRAALIDLATVRLSPAHPDHVLPTQADQVTGTPQFMALALLADPQQHPKQSLTTELESLFYSFLFVATADKLHWKHAPFDAAAAFDSKHSPMVSPTRFEEKVVSRIYLPALQSLARTMRGFFFPSTNLPVDLDADAFLRLLQPYLGN